MGDKIHSLSTQSFYAKGLSEAYMRLQQSELVISSGYLPPLVFLASNSLFVFPQTEFPCRAAMGV